MMKIFVNGKQIGSSLNETLREIKDKILDIVSFEKEKEEKQLSGEIVPLLGDDTETEEMIPLYGEEINYIKKDGQLLFELYWKN